MNDLTLSPEETKLFTGLMTSDSIEVIWDINAFYFNATSETYKLECLETKPVGSDYQNDEIFYCNFSVLKKRIRFNSGNPKYWHKIISTNCKILNTETVTVIEAFPENKLISPQDAASDRAGLNKSTLGLIIETDRGFLPAFLLPSNHGFTWQPKFEFYSRLEIEELVAENLRDCEIKSIS